MALGYFALDKFILDPARDAHLWSQTYDRTIDDVFAIQDEISAHVVEELKGLQLILTDVEFFE